MNNTMFVVAHPKPGVTEFIGCALQVIFMAWYFSRRDLRVRVALQLIYLVARILASFMTGYECIGVAESLIMATINSFVG